MGIRRQAVEDVAAVLAQQVGLGGGSLARHWNDGILACAALSPEGAWAVLAKVETSMRCKGRWASVAFTPVVLAGFIISVGCDRPAAKTARKTAPPDAIAELESGTTGDAQPAAATQPRGTAGDTQPANAYLTVDGKITEFPPARLRLTKTAEGITGLLFSDDPRNAVSAEYKGNSFLFELPLQISDPADIHRASYAYKADDSEPAELTNGVFLQGTRYHLQPQDIAIRFDGEGKKVMAQLAGRFLVVRKDGNPPGQVAAVQGTLYTTAEVVEEK
jgi:hypothetical protein